MPSPEIRKQPPQVAPPTAVSLRRNHLSSTALTAVGSLAFALAVLTTPALADGGGGQNGGTGGGGADSVTGAGAPGGNSAGVGGGGGGGGAGVTGGAGGFGGTGVPTGGPGGSTAGASGTDGTAGASGGSGGGGGAHAFIDVVGPPNLSAPTGGAGGNGGAGTASGGGGGGAGGYGAIVTGSGNLGTIHADMLGGGGGNGGSGNAGGDGGSGGIAALFTNGAGPIVRITGPIVRGGKGGDGGVGGFGGFGGAGGVGVQVNGSGSDVTISNGVNGGAGGAGATGGAIGGNGGNGGIGISLAAGATLTNIGNIAGGDAGAGGAGGITNGTNGAGGAGVVGSDLTIFNTNGITGGLNGDGVTHANAITFTGGTNVLELQFGSSITGNVVAFSAADTLRLGGTTNASFDVSQVGAAAQYQGFGNFVKTGTSTWTLTNTTTALTPWTINQGTLAISADNNLGDTSGGLTFNGGTLKFLSNFGLAATRSITVNAGGATFDVSGGITTISQAFGGSGPITFSNGGVVLAAANTYSGATLITGSTLTIVAASVANAFSPNSDYTVQSPGGVLALNGFNNTIRSLSGNGSANDGSATAATLTIAPPSGTTTFSGIISDTGIGALSLIKTGAGTQILSGANTYSGATTVNGGTLSVNGSIVSAVTVNAGGTLGGNGTVGNTTINGGTLSPGNSIGTLTVNGNLVFTAASSYLVEVSPASADRTNVTGTATLGGATVNAVFAAGTYVTKQYTIINATGGVIGTFGTQVKTNLPSNFSSNLNYDANNAYLNLALNFTPPPTGPSFGTGLSGNQQNVANALVNFFNTTGGIPLAFGALTPTGLTQVSGELATGTQQATFNAMNLFLGLLSDPTINGRGNPVSAGGTPGASGFADEETLSYAARDKSRSPSERDAYAAMARKAPPLAATPFAQRWSTWAAGFGGTQRTDGDPALGSNRTTARAFGGAVGADYRFSPDTLAGFALAGGGTDFRVDNALGTGRSDLFQAGAFVRQNFGPAYISAALAYGWQDVTTDRTLNLAGADLLRARFNANALSGRGEGGYRFVVPVLGGFGLTPYVAGQFTTSWLPGYTEQALAGSNQFALTYGAKSVTDSRSELGFRTDKSYALAGAILTLRGREAWVHDYNPNRNIGATFLTLPGASFTVNGATQPRDAWLSSTSAELNFMNGWSLAAVFDSEWARHASTYAGKGVLRYQW